MWILKLLFFIAPSTTNLLLYVYIFTRFTVLSRNSAGYFAPALMLTFCCVSWHCSSEQHRTLLTERELSKYLKVVDFTSTLYHRSQIVLNISIPNHFFLTLKYCSNTFISKLQVNVTDHQAFAIAFTRNYQLLIMPDVVTRTSQMFWPCKNTLQSCKFIEAYGTFSLVIFW